MYFKKRLYCIYYYINKNRTAILRNKSIVNEINLISLGTIADHQIRRFYIRVYVIFLV